MTRYIIDDQVSTGLNDEDRSLTMGIWEEPKLQVRSNGDCIYFSGNAKTQHIQKFDIPLGSKSKINLGPLSVFGC